MKIEKAIKRLQDSLDHNTILLSNKDKEAQQLGIEALKFKQSWREGRFYNSVYLLPGETEE